MSTYLMFGKYSTDALRGMSPDRTKEAMKIMQKYDGKVESMYALLGEKDLVIIATFPSTDQALKASIVLSRMTGIAFTTSEAFPVEEFDRLTAGI